MSIQLNIFLLLFGGLQGLLFTFFLVRRKLHRSGYIFLLLYFAVLLMQIVLKVMSKSWLMDNWFIPYLLSYQLPFLYGPFIFLFARQVTGGRTFMWRDLLHVAPFLITVVLYCLMNAFYIADQVLYMFFEGETRLALQLVSIAVYHFLAYRCWRQQRVQIPERNWLKQFIVASFVLCSIITFTIYFMYIYYPALNWLRMGFVSLTIFIYWVSYTALTRPDIFSVIPGRLNNGLPKSAAFIPRLQVHRPAKKYSNSSLPEEEAARIVSKLEEVMSTHRPYLEAELTIDKLAQLVSSNRHHLSQVLNERMGLSFYDYINAYRVNQAKQLLADAAHARLKIAAIAYDAGFNSLSAFNDVFKKMTGQTPSQYRKLPDLSERLKRAAE